MAEVVQKPAKGSSSFQVRFSLKNVSAKSITVCAWLGYQPLKVRWIGPDGKMHKSAHYDWLAFVDLAALKRGTATEAKVDLQPNGNGTQSIASLPGPDAGRN